ncbi:MAG TPA: superoxide dismutase family protein [Chitinophagaceae bacterium]|nr:superoxide dismutase family protein [Chitinophagaceae bacterium]
MKYKILSIGVVLSASSLILLACNNDSGSEAGEDTNTHHPDTVGTGDRMSDTASVPLASSAVVQISGTYQDTLVTGAAKFNAADGKVSMELEITVPAKAGKMVAVHLHEHGDCGDNGNLSHGHWNPAGEDHGKWGAAPFHRGDIGNVKLDGKGKGILKMETDLWTLGGSPDKNILGKALIVHGGVDDYKTQPTGNAGSRIGCGVIQ